MADFVMAGDFRNGVTFEMDGKVYTIVDFLHVKPGKGAAFVRTKLRNVISGGVIEKTFNPTDKFPTAHIQRKPYTYSYSDGDLIISWIPRRSIWSRSTATSAQTRLNSFPKTAKSPSTSITVRLFPSNRPTSSSCSSRIASRA